MWRYINCPDGTVGMLGNVVPVFQHIDKRLREYCQEITIARAEGRTEELHEACLAELLCVIDSFHLEHIPCAEEFFSQQLRRIRDYDGFVLDQTIREKATTLLARME